MLVVLAMLALCAVPAQAGGLTVPAGTDVGMARWASLVHNVPAVWVLDITYRPMAGPGPDTPTSWRELLPWAKVNFGIDAAFDGSPSEFMGWRGGGFSEAAKVGSIRKAPIRAGLGYLNTSGLCYFVKAGAIEF